MNFDELAKRLNEDYIFIGQEISVDELMKLVGKLLS
jgi:hypothetical protein